MLIDEPGLQSIFLAMPGYGEQQAKHDMDLFSAMLNDSRGIHLCGTPDWNFLLNLDMDILCMDVYTNGEVFSSYAQSIKRFLDRGGVLVWGIVPTGYEIFAKESLGFPSMKLEGIWQHLGESKLDLDQIISLSMLSPAPCCLVNPDKGKTVETAFKWLTTYQKCSEKNSNVSEERAQKNMVKGVYIAHLIR